MYRSVGIIYVQRRAHRHVYKNVYTEVPQKMLGSKQKMMLLSWAPLDAVWVRLNKLFNHTESPLQSPNGH